jgi:predicted DNA-binding transcriptional regulator AlpA
VADRVDRQEATYLRTSEVAELLHVSPKTVSRWAKEGKLNFPEAVVEGLDAAPVLMCSENVQTP